VAVIYWWRQLEYLEKTIDLSQVTDKLHNINAPTNINDFQTFTQLHKLHSKDLTIQILTSMF
jgi:hypothetical protein